LQDYDKDNVTQELTDKLMPILESSDYTEDKMEKTSKAALGISNWTKAIIKYDKAMAVVKPKQIELAAAEEASAKAKKALDAANENLAKVEAAFAKLVKDLDDAQEKEAKLKAEKDNCEYKVDLANKLITGLAGEKVNWI